MNHNSISNANSKINQKAQKGWLSRWTRKQWSRHWFVLKNGSLTYYRGPAAELCSFLDGVLDLSLIKHIEVQQQEELATGNHHHQHQSAQQQQQHYGQQSNYHYHHHLQHQPPVLLGLAMNNNNSNQNGANSQVAGGQFTFSLKMWNGECHLLGAASAAERSLWLEAINACINGDQDDDAATDSASSSDSSPTSNLSAKSTDIGRPSPLGALASSGRQKHYALNTIGQEIFSCKLAPPNRQNHSNAGAANANRLPPDVVVVERQQQQQNTVNNNSNNSISIKTSNMNSAATVRNSLNEKLMQFTQDKRKLQQLDQMPTINNNSNSRRTAAINSSQEDKVESGKLFASSCSNDGNNREQCDERENGDQEDENIDGESDPGEEQDSVDDGSGSEVEEEDEVSLDEDDNQALKRRLVSIQPNSRILDSTKEPFKLVNRQHQPTTNSSDLYPKQLQPQQQQQQQQISLDDNNSRNTTEDQNVDQEMGSSTSSPSNSSDDEDEDGETEVVCTPSASRSSSGQRQPEDCDANGRKNKEQQQQPSSMDTAEEPKQKQKKRVTFDLSLSSLHHLISSSENSCTSGSESDSSLISSSASSDDEEDTSKGNTNHPEQKYHQPKNVAANKSGLDEKMTDEDSELTLAAQLQQGDLINLSEPSTAGEISEAMETTSSMAQAASKRVEELEVKLDEAQSNIGQLERKLSGSYASYNQLEASYKRLQAELANCDELHKCDLARMQIRVDELTRELSASQLKLVETRDKLLKYEEHLAKQQSSTNNQDDNQNQPPIQHHHSGSSSSRSTSQAKALNWLKANQQVSGNLAQLHQHQPLLLMHHVKHTLAVNQQTLGLKLLNHSKQIQKKLNELELKVDQIQSNATPASPLAIKCFK